MMNALLHSPGSSAVSVHEYRASFRGEQANFLFTSVCGHVFSLDFLAKYNHWSVHYMPFHIVCNPSSCRDTVDPADLFDAETEKKEANPKLNICRFLRQEAKGSFFLKLPNLLNNGTRYRLLGLVAGLRP
jgi:DNA topoisomerase-3